MTWVVHLRADKSQTPVKEDYKHTTSVVPPHRVFTLLHYLLIITHHSLIQPQPLSNSHIPTSLPPFFPPVPPFLSLPRALSLISGHISNCTSFLPGDHHTYLSKALLFIAFHLCSLFNLVLIDSVLNLLLH